jgi:CrcB protein
VSAAVGAGFCGALTTYSTFGYETYRLGEGRQIVVATANVLASVIAGLAAAGLGFAVGGWLR